VNLYETYRKDLRLTFIHKAIEIAFTTVGVATDKELKVHKVIYGEKRVK
jgi:hypothetical protein